MPAAGSLDPFFGTGGMVVTPMGSDDDDGYAVAVGNAGEVVVAGTSWTGTMWEFALVKYKADGNLDPSFGLGGKVTTAFGVEDDAANAVVIDALGRIVVAGQTYNGTDYDFAIARYLPNGTLDPSFDGDGKVTTAFGPDSEFGESIAIDSLGRIVVAGAAEGGAFDFGIARYSMNGSLDTTFDGDGKVTTDFGDYEWGYSVALDPAGRIIVAGEGWNGTDWDFVLARYNTNGSPDMTFDGDGKVTTAIGPSSDNGYAVAVDRAGRIVVGGATSDAAGNADLALVRYDVDGSLDLSFGGDGIVVTDFGTDFDQAISVAIDGSDRIVVAAQTGNGEFADFAVARYLDSGSLDPTFHGTGKVITPIGDATYDAPLGMTLDKAGRIVVAGYTNNGGNDDIAVVRYLTEFRALASRSDLTYVENDAATVIDGSIALTNSPNANLAGARVQLGNYLRNQDVLGYTLQGGIIGNFDSTSGVLTLSGAASVAAYETVLRSLTYSNTSEQPFEQSRTISITVDDGESHANMSTATYTIHVVAANDAPAFTSDGLLAPIAQGLPNPPGQKVAGLFVGRFEDPDAGNILKGIAVMGNTASPLTEGSWQYSTNNGGTWFNIGLVSDPAALALTAGTRIRFLPVAAFSGQPAPLSVRAIDSTFTGAFTSGAIRAIINASINGGTTPIAADPANIETQILPAGTGGNTPPTLQGVPVSANLNEGQTLSFDASATDPDAGQDLTFSLAGAPPAASIDPDTGEFTWTTTEADGPNTFVFNVQVTDGFTVTEKSVVVIIREVNTAPTLAGVPASATLIRGNTLTFTATVTDPDLVSGLPNTQTFSLVGAPAGASIDPDTGVVTWTPSETAPLGRYSFNVRVTDDGVPAKSASKPIAVTLTTAFLSNGVLYVGGTAANDVITVNPSRDGTQLVVKLGTTTLGNFLKADVTDRIVVRGLGGNDRITISPKIAIAADLYGDAGNDALTGGSGNDRLFGDLGNDKLAGGAGNNLLDGGDGKDALTGGTGLDVLVGGDGADVLNGGVGDDLLIAGRTSFDLAGLMDIFREWTSGASYADRVNHLSGAAGGQNGTTFLNATTVGDDAVKDALVGAAGTDWFVVHAFDTFDLKPGEQKLQL